MAKTGKARSVDVLEARQEIELGDVAFAFYERLCFRLKEAVDDPENTCITASEIDRAKQESADSGVSIYTEDLERFYQEHLPQIQEMTRQGLLTSLQEWAAIKPQDDLDEYIKNIAAEAWYVANLDEIDDQMADICKKAVYTTLLANRVEGVGQDIAGQVAGVGEPQSAFEMVQSLVKQGVISNLPAPTNQKTPTPFHDSKTAAADVPKRETQIEKDKGIGKKAV